MPHPLEGGTALHVAAWKAPPALFVKMIRLLPRDAREISVLMGIRDGEGMYISLYFQHTPIIFTNINVHFNNKAIHPCICVVAIWSIEMDAKITAS